MEVNKEEALRCLNIAQRHRNSSNLPSALKFAKKSVSLYSTPEGEKMITIIEQEISISASDTGGEGNGSAQAGTSGTSTPNAEAGGSGSSKAKASGVEEHVSSAHQRAGHSAGAKPAASASGGSGTDKGKKREYTAKQMEVVKRVKSCKHHEYYEILAVEKTCEENDVKRAYKKLALALHPDKNGAPGADEAFKMVSKAFQILSDTNLRAAFDSNPHSDPTQRGGGGGGGGGGMYRGGGGMHPGFGGNGMYTEVNPEDLFNAFFGGGGFGGGGFGGGHANGGFQAHFGNPQRRRAAGGGAGNANEATSPLIALLPVLVLCIFALLSAIPTFFGSPPDPSYSFDPTTQYDLGRKTWNFGVPYWVNKEEWGKSDLWSSVPESRRGEERAAMFSGRVKGFERGVENVYAQRLRNECERFSELKERRVAQEAGFFGIGADYDKIREIRAEKSPACEQLRQWGMLRNQGQSFY